MQNICGMKFNAANGTLTGMSPDLFEDLASLNDLFVFEEGGDTIGLSKPALTKKVLQYMWVHQVYIIMSAPYIGD